MEMAKEWFFRSEEGKVYGPAEIETLKTWVKDGRIEPTGFVSKDRVKWIQAPQLPELEMKWLVETQPGKIFGPFNRELVKHLVATGDIPQSASIYRRYEMPVDKDPEPVVIEKVVEKIVKVPVQKAIAIRKTSMAPVSSGFFKGIDFVKLVALERAAQRELAAARQRGIFSFLGGRK